MNALVFRLAILMVILVGGFVLVDLDAQEPSQQGTVMFEEVGRAEGIHLRALALGATDDLHTQVKSTSHGCMFVKRTGNSLEKIGALASHTFLDVEPLALGAQAPALLNMRSLEGDVAQSIIVVGVVFVVDATLQSEAGLGDVGNDPFFLPLGLASLADGSRSLGQDGILLVSLRDGRSEGGLDVRVAGLGRDIGGGQVLCLVEDEPDGEARGDIRKGSRVITAGRKGLVLEFLLFISGLVLQPVETSVCMLVAVLLCWGRVSTL